MYLKTNGIPHRRRLSLPEGKSTVRQQDTGKKHYIYTSILYFQSVAGLCITVGAMSCFCFKVVSARLNIEGVGLVGKSLSTKGKI